MENQTLYQQEQQKRERDLAAYSHQLSDAVRNFMTQCYLDAIPAEQFTDFWCAASSTNNGKVSFAVVEREATYAYLNETEKKVLLSKIRGCINKKESAKALNTIKDMDFAKSVRRSLGKEPSYETRKALLGAADLAATFKMNTELEKNVKALEKAGFVFCKKFSLYEILEAAYWKDKPKEEVPGKNDWMRRNSQARQLRNKWDGHATSQTYRTEDGELLSIREWQGQAMKYLAVVNPLHTPQNDHLYQEIDRVMKEAIHTENCKMYPLAKFTEHCSYSTDKIRQIFQEYKFECTEDSVYCVFDEAWGYLRKWEVWEEQSRHFSEFTNKTHKIRRLLQDIENELSDSGMPGMEAQTLSVPQEPPLPPQEQPVPQHETPSPREQLLCSKLLEEQLKDVPPIQALKEYSGGPLEQKALRELVTTHRILLDGSVLRHRDGRRFLMDMLVPVIRQSGKELQDVLMIDATTMYHFMEQMQRYKQLDAALLDMPRTAVHEGERARLADERDRLHSAQSAYIFVRDQLRLSPAGIPDPLCPDDDATLEFLQANPFQRTCILTCGATALVRRIDRGALPLVAVARVCAMGGSPQISIFSQFLPLTERNVDDPYLNTLMQSLISENMLEDSLCEEDDFSPNDLSPADGQTPSPAEDAENEPPISLAPASTQNVGDEQKAFLVPAQNTEDKPKEPQASVQSANAKPKASREPVQEKAAGATDPAATPAPKKAHRYPPNAPLRPLDPALLPLSALVRPGDSLHTENGDRVVLRACLLEDGEEAKGGEGALFLTDAANQVAKLYFADHLSVGRRDKLLAMLEGNPGLQGLCWPDHVLYNQHEEFVGYLMPQAPADAMPFSKSVLKIGYPSQRNKLMPDWDRRDLVQAACGAAMLTAGLHRNNILMGDVNAGNFMVDVKDSRRVFLVDTDSFQLDGYPCPVGVEEFTHPGTAARLGIPGELRFGTFLRTREEEEYALAVLLFEILFLNTNPFTLKSEMNFLDAMRQKCFPYTSTETGWTVPDGDEWMIWKNLPKKICDAFSDTFSQWKTTPAEGWASLMKDYLYLIEYKNYSSELTPLKYHEFHPEDPWFVDVNCPKCGREFNTPKRKYTEMTQQNKPIFCRNCLRTLTLHGKEIYGEKRTCSQCGKPYTVTVWDEMYFECGLKKPICENCARPEVSCDGCGKNFRMPANLYRDRKRKNEPMICRDCAGNETVKCGECGRSYSMPRWQAVKARRTGTRFLCTRCRNTSSVVCASCGKTYREQNSRIEFIRSKGQQLFCSDCWKKVACSCAACGTHFEQERWRTMKNDQESRPNLCASCRRSETLQVHCSRCNQAFEMPSKTFFGCYHHNKPVLCSACYRRYR